MKKIKIKTKSQQYDYCVTENIAQAGRLLNSAVSGKQAFLIIDENVFRIWRGQIFEMLNAAGIKPDYFVTPNGEKAKSFQVLQALLKAMLDKKLDRGARVIAVGGGVTGDLAGFAASIFKRGISVIHVPTTLLSMVDSSIGGKTGINFDGYKNIIGTIKQPGLVVAEKLFLKSLPEKEFLSGLGEVMKYAFLGDDTNYRLIRRYFFTGQFNPADPPDILTNCVRIKAGVVSQDETETGIRKILNLGHTFAHAYESVSKYRIPHGMAVILGLRAAIHASRLAGLLASDTAADFLKLAYSIKVPYKIAGYPHDLLLQSMQNDKKSKSGMPLFILLGGVGQLVIDFPLDSAIAKEALILSAAGR